jgi:hypothetical protein
VSLSGESGVSNDSLNFRGFLSFLSVLGGEFSSNHAFLDQSDVIRLLQGEELSDFVGTLGAQTSGDVDISESGDLLFSLLRDRDGQHGDIVSDDASSHRFSFSFTLSSFSETFLVLIQKESHSSVDHDTLSHGEALLVVTTGDLEVVTFKFVTEADGIDFLAHSFFNERVAK